MPNIFIFGQKETQAAVTLDDSVTAEGYDSYEYDSDEHGLPDISIISNY